MKEARREGQIRESRHLGWVLYMDGEDITFANARRITGDPRLAAMVVSVARGATD